MVATDCFVWCLGTQFQLPKASMLLDLGMLWVLTMRNALIPLLYVRHQTTCTFISFDFQAFGKILAEFTQTFRPTVQIVTISGLAQLRPVIGHSNINAYVWRLELRNLRFPNNGPLPYDRVLTVFIML